MSGVTDVPGAAYTKAVRALGEFDVLVVEYGMLIDTERALLNSGNREGVEQVVTRGDSIARAAALCGRRVSPLIKAIDSGQFAGPRASQIKRRSAGARSAALAVAASAALVAEACAAQRDDMGREIRRDSAGRGRTTAQPGYRVGAPLMIDTRA